MLVNRHADGHIHTERCHHAIGSMEEYVLCAIDKGLSRISFLEHMEEGIVSSRTTWLTEDDFDDYFAEGRELQQRYRETITIELGVEAGFNPDCVEPLRSRLARRSWDRIGLSYHFHRLSPAEDHLNLVSRNEPRLHRMTLAEAADIERLYYGNLIKAVDLLPGTVVCHIDAALRHYPGRASLQPPWDLIEMLLDRMKMRDLELEINTSGIAMRGATFPDRRIISLAIAKKVRLSAGSDAHKPEDVGQHFEKLEEIG